jgi:hypothetical protein
MVFVMSLFAAAAMTDDGVLQTQGTSAKEFRAGLNPTDIEVVLRGRKCDKENRDARGLLTGKSSWQDLSSTRNPPLRNNKSQLEKE